MTADDDLRLIRMIRTLLTELELDLAAFETAIALRPPKARRMSDEIRDALRTRTPMATVSGSEHGVSEAGEVAARSIQAVQMVLENKSQALPLYGRKRSNDLAAGMLSCRSDVVRHDFGPA